MLSSVGHRLNRHCVTSVSDRQQTFIYMKIFENASLKLCDGFQLECNANYMKTVNNKTFIILFIKQVHQNSERGQGYEAVITSRWKPYLMMADLMSS